MFKKLIFEFTKHALDNDRFICYGVQFMSPCLPSDTDIAETIIIFHVT